MRILFFPNQPFPLFEIDLGLKMINGLEEIRAKDLQGHLPIKG